ncbi:nuclear transport factor 2 family protein [Kitasatospora purpeofusca]|uniref:nuclear transport factor 2 family protein n=1 Tax=Kitasatospora purpeofusca TaxID=67352 RepID=UPI00224EEC7E|nr:nuclear transport factor 2 family protein [Kitasatospora purpeofusca]MCX4685860.1 nuclear transport factor 2 family protein [Kitasatospora purpeofusca]
MSTSQVTTSQAATSQAAGDPRTVVVDYVNAVARGDLDAVTAAFTEDVTWTYPGDLPLSGVWRGRDAVVGDFLGGAGRLFAPGSAVEVTLTGVLADGDRVLAEWTSRGTTVHGLRYDNRCAGVFTVREGRIAAVREYTDTDHVARTLFADR